MVETLQDDLKIKGDDLGRIVLNLAEECVSVGREVRYGLRNGKVRGTNPSGEDQVRLDLFANEGFKSCLSEVPWVRQFASEEILDVVGVNGDATYSVAYDPFDGSKNAATNGPTGSIFALHEGDLMSGRTPRESLVGAFYVFYGGATTLVASFGEGVQEYQLDRDGEWVRIRDNIRMADDANRLCSGGAKPYWSEKHKKLIAHFRGKGYKDYFSKCLVSDMNQTLLLGNQIFVYPLYRKEGQWKAVHRAMFELHAMAYLIEQAGGMATDGVNNILDVAPANLHERKAFYAGCKNDIEMARTHLRV